MSHVFELVIPCYNESRSLSALIDRVILSAKEFGLTAHSFQLVLVQNGSQDNSLEVMTDLAKSEKGAWFRIINIPQNQGYGFGIWSGILSTTAPIIGWSHADLQCNPRDAFRAYEIAQKSLNENSDCLVKGIRKGRAFKEIFISRGYDVVCRLLLGFSSYEINAQPKIFHRKLVALITHPPKDFSLDLYLLYKAHKNNFDIKAIQVDFPPRLHGNSSWASTLKGRYRMIRNSVLFMWNLRQKEGRL